MVPGRIYWDEENSPAGFYLSWAICFVLTAILLNPFHLVWQEHRAILRAGSTEWTSWPGILWLLTSLIAFAMYANLIVNAILHRNPDLDESTNEEQSDGLNPGTRTDFSVSDASPKLFEQSIEKNDDPIVVRDEIQWRRIGVSTGMTLVLAVELASALLEK